ncbi:MAG: SH3 domain-containing protein [Bacteroidota bacterium]|nr:SH3 domain-containing protein [Bacteroidota bacterium]
MRKKKRIIKKGLFSGAVILGVFPLLFVIYLLLAPVISVIEEDFTSKEMRIISETLKIRAEKEPNSYIIGQYDYGTEVLVHEIFKNEWAEVSVGEKRGFMSMEYLVTPEQFYLIDGLYGNELAKRFVRKTSYRKAISTYLQENGFTTDIPKEIREKLFDKNKKPGVWQLFAEENSLRYNTFCYGDFDGDNFPDAAYILKNINTGQRKLIVLNLNTDIPDKYSKLIYSEDLEEDWVYIRTAVSPYFYIVNGERRRIKIDGIIKGSNRDESLNDSETMLLFSGKTFDSHLQEEVEDEE